MNSFLLLLISSGLATYAAGIDRYSLDDPKEPWRQLKSGISTNVMSPYSGLLRDSNKVYCWGRSYELGVLFPASIVSQEQKILVEPIVLKIKMNNSWTAVSGFSPSFGQQREDRIEFFSHIPLGALEISTRSWIEYDGLIRVDMRLAAKEVVEVQGLEIIFPFTPESSIFYHTEVLWGPHIYKESPAKIGEVVFNNWQPLIWVGNHNIGFTVVMESREGWTSFNDTIEFKRNGQSMDLTLRIINKPVQIQEEKIYTFGLQATPVKEMRTDRWNTVIGTLPGENLRSLGPVQPFEPLFSYPQPNNFEEVANNISDLHKQGIRSCYYITTSATSEKSEVNKRNHENWLISKAIFGGGEWKVGQGLIGADSCCPASSFSDFMAWAVENVMNTFDVDGIYIDNPGPYRCENRLHGCGKGGVETYPYFALRDLHKRIYTIVKTRKPDGFVWEHTSQRFNSLQMSWLDVYSDGEHFRESKVYSREDLANMIDRTYLDITATGYQMGVIPAFLSSLTVREDRKDGEWSDWLLSRLLPYGQMVWAHQGWMDASLAMAAAKARSDFGLGVEPVNFYRPHELPKWLVMTSPKSIIACMWQRKRDEAAMVVLSNWNGEAILVRISHKDIINKYGLITLQDSLTGITIPNEYMMISIPANSFRMITIVPKSFK